jgi:hypothetical protein
MKVYKLVVDINGKYYSFIADPDERCAVHPIEKDDLVHEYKIREKTVPKFGFLYAFDTLENSLRFYNPGLTATYVRVFEAKAEVAKKDIKPFSLNYNNLSVVNVINFWKNFSNYTEDDILYTLGIVAPSEGSVLCSSITLNRMITSDEIEKAWRAVHKMRHNT